MSSVDQALSSEEDWPEEKECKVDFQELLIQMRSIGVALKQLCKIPPGELAMLITLIRAVKPDLGVRPSELGRKMHMSRPAVSRMLRSMKEKGFLAMSCENDDHRFMEVALTEKGKECLEKEITRCADVLKRVMGRMGDVDVAQMLYYNQMFIQYLEEEVEA